MDLPPRLSDQQLFVLATIRQVMNRRLERGRLTVNVNVHGLSKQVAEEFDDGDRIHRGLTDDEHREQVRELRGRGEHMMADIAEQHRREDRGHAGRGGDHLTNAHSSSFSRALTRLEDRELLVARTSRDPRGYREPKRTGVRLTDEGREVADEVLRRHRDGRYSLSFDTLD